MTLPDLIEIVPLDKPVRAEITVPGSKSITNRALILAALADGEMTLEGALWSEDTQVMVEALRTLGFEIHVEPDPAEACNRRITIHGLGGQIPSAGTVKNPLGLFVGNAGTAARFLAALVCLGDGVFRLSGTPRMYERPQSALFKALRELGYGVDSPNDKLPAVIHGGGPKPGARCHVSIAESSQFASALLLCSKTGGWSICLDGDNSEESAYVQMTQALLQMFEGADRVFQIEPDASSASYFLAMGGWLPMEGQPPDTREFSVMIFNWPGTGCQIDANFMNVVSAWAGEGVLNPDDGANGNDSGNLETPFEYSRATDLGDSIMTAIMLAPLQRRPMRFVQLGRLRLQECERVVALRTELTKCGAKVVEEGDTLTVYPSKLHGAEIETYNDHRMAMCFAILGLKVPGIKIKNPACVKKTFPNFFQKLAAPPSNGLGATILDAKTGRKLEVSELFAD